MSKNTTSTKVLRGCIKANETLSRFRVKDKGGEFTNTGMNNSYPNYKFSGTFYVPEDDYDTFLGEIGEYVFDDKLSLGITEKHHPEFSPIIIDLDFRYPPIEEGSKEAKRYHTKRDIQKFIKLVFNRLNTIMEMSKLQIKKPKFFVLERPEARFDEQKNVIKDGVHIICKDIQLTYPILFLLRDKVIKNMHTVFSNKIFTVKQTFSEIYDKAVIRDANWMIHGCTKKGLPAYNLTAAYVVDIENENKVNGIRNPTKRFDNKYLIKELSVRSGIIGSSIRIRDEARRQVSDYIDKLEKRNKIVPNAFNMSNRNINIDRPTDQYIGEVSNQSYYEFIDKLVECLSPERATPYESWIKVGWALRNIASTHAVPDKVLFGLFVKFSKKSPNYIEGLEYKDRWHEKYWCTHKHNGPMLTEGSLRYWAKMDNPAKFKEIIDKSVDKLIEDAVNNNSSHVSVARVISELFKGEFICIKPGPPTNSWYYFDKTKHRWAPDCSANHLYKKITKVLTKVVADKIISIRQRQRRELEDDDNQIDNKKNEEEVKPYRALNSKIQDMTYIEKVTKACSYNFYNEDFIKNLDTNLMIIGFDNGVYDLETLTFRDGRPEDYLSKTVGYDYNDDIDMDCHEVKLVLNTIRQILPHKDIRDYLMKVFASCLYGVNKDQSFWICQNDLGANGKTLLMEFMLHVLGPNDDGYANKLNVALLLQKRQDANGASPEVAKLKGKRFTYAEEPDKDAEINIGLMKELTGGGRLVGRFLNKNSIEFQNTTKFFMLCNDLPNIPSDDQGTWRRIKTVEFPSRFIHRDEEIPYEEQYPADEHIYPRDDSLPKRLNEDCKMAMMYILLDYYKQYLHGGKDISVPKKVREAGERFARSQDKIGHWIANNIELKEGSVLKLRDVRETMRRDYSKEDVKKVTLKDIEKKILRIFKKEHKNNEISDKVGVNRIMGLGIKDNMPGDFANFGED
jgi:P4 family phage/plasmid primase-like protien